MADDLDDQLRAAMKTLDEQVPSGYFEALPNQTLARLEGSMQQQYGTSGSSADTGDDVATTLMAKVPLEADEAPAQQASKPMTQQREEEDSGLHDIRNLAQSTKQRMASRRASTSPPISDDVLASASGSFKNIALPQPAAMVSLPAVSELPSKADIAAAEKAHKEAAKKAAKEAKAEPVAAAPAVSAAAAPSIERKAFSLPSQQTKSSKGPLLAIVGLGVAAAAGAVIYMQVGKTNEAAAPATVAAEQPKVEAAAVAAAPAAGSAVTAEPIAPPEPPPAAEPAKEEVPAAAPIATDVAKADEHADKASKKSKASKGGKLKVEAEEPKTETKAPEKAEAKKPAAKGGGDGEGEPSFDALLKEAGVNEKKEAKPTLEKKALTSDDFKKGIGEVVPKAKGCYKGTQGTAMVKLTVAPSGAISKVSVVGDFAGKPEAACVSSAIKAATFPPWDGGPQSFTYAVLLSD